MRANDAVAGLVLIVIAAVMAALTIPFPDHPGQRYGPDLLPRLLAGGLAVCGALLIRRGLALRRQGTPARDGVPWLTVAGWVREPRRATSFLLVIAALLAYILLADRIGFVPVSFGIVLVLALWFGARPHWALLTAVVATGVIHWFFGSVMRVPLPRGVLDWML